MIIQKGLIGKFLWQPGTYATDVMCACFEAYVAGATVSCEKSVIQKTNGSLKVSFGKGAGHSTAIRKYVKRHPKQDIFVVSNSYIPPSNSCRWLIPELLGSFLGELSWLPEMSVVFVDMNYLSYMDHFDTLTRELPAALRDDSKVIVTISDGLETHNWPQPVLVEVEGHLSQLKSLGCDGYDIAPQYRKENYEPS